jgi:hypothetical protein
MSRIAVVVPTRNRADLAAAAVRSVVDQGVPGVAVVVSDNSTDQRESERLERLCATLDPDAIRLVRPPEPMAMVAHWQWALDTALAQTGAGHVAFLTDRMIFKAGELEPVIRLCRAHPGDVLAYNHDAVLDDEQPVRVRQEPWSGRLFRVRSDHLLFLSSRAVIHASLPRMLNCLVPRAVLESVAGRFGTVFASVSPDFCFAYRCLATVPSTLYYDKAPLVHYALPRSHGASVVRGVDSETRLDFVAQLGSAGMNFAAPVPEFQTIRNAILHEYAYVRAESGSDAFPEIDPRGYLAAIVEDLSQAESHEMRARMLDVLSDNGWVGAPKKRYDAAMLAIRVMFRGWDVVRLGSRLATRLVPVGPRFATSAEALAHVQRSPRPPETGLEHVPALFSRPGATTEIVGPATSEPTPRVPAPG